MEIHVQFFGILNEFVTFEDKWGKTSENARFFLFQNMSFAVGEMSFASVKWVLPSVKWVLTILGEMSFGQNAQKKAWT